MRKIHTFQKYSQRENWVTNNTLLFLSRFQKHNNSKFANLINVILQENNLALNIGVNFYQQERGSESVYDGTISQEEFKIAIETKLFDNFNIEQLKNHINSISNVPGKNRILLALSKTEISNDIKSQVISCIKSINSDIKFASVSFCNLIDLVRANIAEYEIEMHEIINEFYEFCKENDLIKDESEYMLVFTAGTSLNENLKYELYYDPVARNHNTEFKKIGLYASKAIVAIGDVQSCVWANLENNCLIINNGVVISEALKERIKELILKTDYYDIRFDHKFYVVDKFYKTNYRKRSYGPLRGKAYFRIQDLPGCRVGMSAKDISIALNEKEWV